MQYEAQELDTTSTQKGADPAQPDQLEQAVAAQSLAELTQKLEAEQLKTEEYLDMLRRTQADFINYRRRIGQEENEGRTTAQIAVLDQILPVLDDLGRALQAVPPELANNSWVQGILLVAKRLMAVLEQLGVRQVGRPGEQFDPRWHEALSTEAHSNVPEGTILHVTRPGYAIGERVIRPAQVIVARSSQEANAR
jgi:molecular chaperone GrpE